MRSSPSGARVVGAWRVKAVPLTWTEEDLLQVLRDAGWLEVEVLALPKKNSDLGWSVLVPLRLAWLPLFGSVIPC